MKQVFSFKVLLYFLYTLIALFYFRNSSGDTLLIIFFISLSIYLFGFSTLINSVFLGKKMYRIFFLNIFFSRILLLALLAGLLISEMNLPVICFSFIIGAGVHVILNLYQLNKMGFEIRFSSIKINTLKEVLKSSAVMGTGILFVIIYDRVDVLLLEKILGYSFVAFYSVAYSLYKIPQVFANTILVPAFTNFSADFSRQNKISKHLLKQSVSSLIIISFVFCLIYYTAGEFLLSVIYGSVYTVSASFLQLLIIAIPAIIMNNFTGILLNSINREQVPMKSTFIGMMLNILVCLLIIPSLGIKGAVISTIITEYFVLIFQLVSLKKINSENKIIN